MLGKKVWGILMATAMTVSTVIGGAVVTNAECQAFLKMS